MRIFLPQLLLVSTFLASAKKSKKNERASLLGLTDDYSTFELPYKYSPNLIKIGEFYSTLRFPIESLGYAGHSFALKSFVEFLFTLFYGKRQL